MPSEGMPWTRAEREAHIAAANAKRERQERRRREKWAAIKAAFAAARA